ncbi:helix-turn-helix transcriptional regulator [Streptomyces luteolus]|uniref:Helix-turn-helix transcriptional regulator n=1 Tax=Streptomyces luteolus TaxID=3043615 RepID=A0ABT6SQP5_9ACTN|nr:helix-turn-helix transcriptional regulator [Streptomyces sp. B-S-A12]MDI3417900.1 helix-turn-helix transcriptional regulator [Streptomyces sp. B-S-A12]
MTAATFTTVKPNPARIGNPHLRAALIEAGLTYEELAFQLRVDPKTVERWVNEPGRRPYARHAHAVARVLGCDVWDLWPAQRPAMPDPAETTSNGEASAMVSLARRALERAEGLNLTSAQPTELALMVGELTACLRGLTGLHDAPGASA